jgi:hypothetical protein
MARPIDHMKEFVQALGSNKVFEDIPNRIAHRMAHSPEILLHEHCELQIDISFL